VTHCIQYSDHDTGWMIRHSVFSSNKLLFSFLTCPHFLWDCIQWVPGFIAGG